MHGHWNRHISIPTLRVYGPSTFLFVQVKPRFSDRPEFWPIRPLWISPLFLNSPQKDVVPKMPRIVTSRIFQVWTRFNTVRHQIHRIPPVAILQGFRISGGFLHELPCGLIPRIAVRNEGSEGQPRRRGRLEAIRLTEKMERVRFRIYIYILFQEYFTLQGFWLLYFSLVKQSKVGSHRVQRNMGSSPLNNESQFEPQHF